jgi:hypothetical protein
MSEDQTTGRGIAGLVTGLGWLAVVCGVGLVVYGVYSMFQSDFGLAAGGPLMAGGAVTFALGLLSIITATMAKAMIDTANNTARLLEGGSIASVPGKALIETRDDDLPDFGKSKKAVRDTSDVDLDEVEQISTDLPSDEPGIPPFDIQSHAAPVAAAAIVPDMSDPRGWPLAIDEFDLDGHLAMTLEDGTIGVETPQGWHRLQNMEEAQAWLAQQA